MDYVLAYEIGSGIEGRVFDEASLSYLKQRMVVNSMTEILLFLKIRVPVYRDDGKEPFCTAVYDARAGFDETFIEQCYEKLVVELPSNWKHQPEDYTLFLVHSRRKVAICTRGGEKNLFTERFSELHFKAPKEYSSFELMDLAGKFTWFGHSNHTAAIDSIAYDDKEMFQEELNLYEKEDFQFWNEEKVSDFITSYLSLLRMTLDPVSCRSEANRRLILNVFLMFVSAYWKNFLCGVQHPREGILEAFQNRSGSLGLSDPTCCRGHNCSI